MTQAEDFFDPWQRVVSSWEAALAEINNILYVAGNKRDMAWRGVHNASFALHSSLYRRFVDTRGTVPDEADLLRFELELLRRSRTSWRFDNLAALELLAHLQHYGGPTRMLDVTFNPLIALWFAVEQKFDRSGNELPDEHGRIFAFDVTGRQISLDETWGARDLPWATAPSSTWRNGLPMVWRPPSYNDRIPAQNSAFLIGGVPSVRSGDNAKYRKTPGNGSISGLWNVDEVRRSTSVTMSMNSLDNRAQRRSTPTYTLKIDKAGKPEIRSVLEKSFGFNTSTIYPDLFGLANNAANGIPTE